jgi:hypothetical protein
MSSFKLCDNGIFGGVVKGGGIVVAVGEAPVPDEAFVPIFEGIVVVVVVVGNDSNNPASFNSWL